MRRPRPLAAPAVAAAARPPRPGVRASAQASATVHVDGGGSPPPPRVGRHSSPAAAPPPPASGPAPPPPPPQSLSPFGSLLAPLRAPAEPEPGAVVLPAWGGLVWPALARDEQKPLPRKAPMAEPACERLPACRPGILFGRVAPQILKKRSKFLSDPEFKTCHGKEKKKK